MGPFLLHPRVLVFLDASRLPGVLRRQKVFSASSCSKVLSGGLLERRQSTRIPFRVKATISQSGADAAGETSDISDNGIGLSLASSTVFKEGENVFVSVFLQGDGTRVSVTLPCSIARTGESAIGCTSTYLEPETFLFISNLIHSGDRDVQVMQSFYSHIDSITPKVVLPSLIS